ncbi:ankyrin repeat domain-containing protein [Flavivirga jejuensis]|uniref:Ankyrin repeat domain-containing protein n=1 Tax=Flavivirga jejuensis TaxID=870487 RepID=A0ABT8WUB9_9FLAO|nr:ankyrin repeat domain-containing protein [Flavivirga jejuensis]MDO5976787.1 ankyrin repeat domain-containing protein [Flavivirga jejuensis]
MSDWNPDDLSTYSSFEHPDVAKDAINLIKNGADPNIKDNKLEATPLIKTSVCINENSLKVAETLIEAGADVNLTNKLGATALHELIIQHSLEDYEYENHLKGAKLLINNGANIDTFSEGWFYETPLHLAVYKNAKDMVSLLIKSGANINVKNSEGQTPKEVAIQKGFKEIENLF